MFTFKRKVLKANKLTAWFIILSIVFSLGINVWSEEDNTDEGISEVSAESETESEEDSDGVAVITDLPLREEEELLSQMELYAETPELELYVLETYNYTGRETGYVNLYLFDENGKLFALEYSEYENFDDMLPVYDINGEPVLEDNGVQREIQLNRFNRVEIPAGELPDDMEGLDGFEGDSLEDILNEDIDPDETVTRFTYSGLAYTDIPKTKEEGIFAVKNKANGYIWWSNPINAAHDPYAKPTQVDSLSSPIEFISGNPETYSTNVVRSNTQANEKFVNAIEKIEKIDNGARFRYAFTKNHTSLAMDVTLDGDSVVVTIPQSEFKEDKIVADTSGLSPSVMLTLSVLNSFGAAPEGEDGYVVVADGSGAVIEFDNGKINSAQYSGRVYGRDYSVSQKFAPTVNQQVFLPVYGIVRGENALVAIAEKGDENAVIRAAVSRQGSNSTSYNLAWFDFRMRTTDSFYIGTNFEELSIYESGYSKVGDISVRYYPLAAQGNKKELSYVDVADAYRKYLTDYKGVSAKEGTDRLPFYMSLNGGTIKRHSIAGFPVNLQTVATTYEQAETMLNDLKGAGINDFVITYNDFSDSGIKRRVASKVQYSGKLGGESDFKSLNNAVSQNGVLYPSMGFMEFQKSGGGYSATRHAPREVTRSRAVQQKYELAFGTPDSLQKVSSILSPYYFGKVFDEIAESLKSEGITSISLDNATSLLYSDFSRKNPYGGTYFNRRDTAQILTEGFKKLTDAGISIMAQTANAYALPYVSHISNVPLSSSNYDIFDYDVPFYQMVIQGLIPYSCEPFNGNPNVDEIMLSAIAVAAPPHYEFMYNDPADFDDSLYNKKFYTDYKDWVDDSVSTYNMFESLVGDLVGVRIVSHERLSVGEYQTEFEGGKKIYINLSTRELKIDGKPINLQEFKQGVR